MFENKKILILGLARSGYSAAKTLCLMGNEVILNDAKTEDKLDKEQVNELKKMGVRLILGSHPDNLLDSSFDFLIKNPGVPINHKYVVKAKKIGIEVINEVEFGYRLLPSDVKIVAVTGTNGKTTTTILIYELLKSAFGDKVHLAGNIGYPLCSILNKIKSGDILVMEISCQQLENLNLFNPDVAVMTNLSPAHIDFFNSYENYVRVKTKLFKNQNSSNVAILNIDNNDVLNSTKFIKSTTKYFSSSREINGAYLKDGNIYYYDECIMDIKNIFISGLHNIENCMAAIMAVKEFGVSNSIIEDVISKFRGVEHRLEYVDTIRGRKFYNDTEATNIKCTQIALSSFNDPIILILGGLDRGQNFNELSLYMKNVKVIIGIGQCRNKVLEFGSSLNIPTFIYEHLSDGFDRAVDESCEGDIILLSPASASWDQYKECEVRGAEFKNKVYHLKEDVSI